MARTISQAVSAHPRSRGENHCHNRIAQAAAGSSPLTRGKQVGVVLGGAEVGLIPAHAGKTGARSPATAAATAHPRSRGENAQAAHPGSRPEDSSPLTRGKRQSLCCRRPQGRLIPAHAGKTLSCLYQSPKGTAHPRSRGENPFPSTKWAGSEGSSPLTRGKPTRNCGVTLSSRLIPAHAGKTWPASCVCG